MSPGTPSPDRVAGGCPSEDELAAFAGGELVDARVLEVHLDACERCRRVVSALAAAALDDAPIVAARGSTGLGPSGAATEPAVSSGAPSSVGLAPGQRLGRFTVTRPLGHGAMGEVWAARDPELDREVALKLLRVRTEALGMHAATRLRREAQAMARLSHPNVVSIYELGSAGDRVFCAMELIDGITLRRWLEAPRAWREVLDVALAVGRGVAAAHAAGLIHRDIKPDNVLMARDGRTLVTDFGLAKLVDLRGDADADAESDRAAPPDRATPHDPDSDVPSTERHALSSTVLQHTSAVPGSVGELTSTGMVVGTPAYMPPEQIAGGVVDAQSDQFSYCVTVYEALFGVRPFAGATLTELAAAMRSGPARPPARGKVPRPVIACLLRGLAADKQRRWPSLDVLLAELRRRSLAPRRHRIAASATLALALGTGAVLWARPAPQVDDIRAAAESRIARAWGPSQSTLLRAAFDASKVAVAGERAATVVRVLDAYRAEWLAMRVDAWAATHVRGEQSRVLLERRLACFDDLADDLAAIVRLLSSAGAAEIARAPEMAYALEPIATCADPHSLETRSPPPSTPEGRAAEDDLRELETLQLAGRRGEALARGTELLAEAERLGDPALLARATFHLGSAQANVGKHAEAEVTLRRAVQQAASARDHVLVAKVWLRLFDVVGHELGRADEALAFESAVRAAVAQAGDDPRQVAELASALGYVANARGRFHEARTYFTEARDRHIAARGPAHPHVGNVENNLGGVLLSLGELDEATRHLERSIEIMEAAMGPTNPVVGKTLFILSSIAGRRKDWVTSERYLRRSIKVNEQLLGPDHPESGKTRIFLARALRNQGRHGEAATELAAARQALEKTLPPTHVQRIMLDVYDAQLAEVSGKFADAERLGAKGLAALRKAVPADHPQFAFVLAEQARFLARRAPADALALYDEALNLYLGGDGREVTAEVETLREIADAALAARAPDRALHWFDRLPEAGRQLAPVRAQLERARRPRTRK